MSGLKSNRQVWGHDFPIDGEWDAGATPPHLPPEQTGRWTVRREAERFSVVFHCIGDGQETILVTFPPNEQGELDAKTYALGAYQNLQTLPQIKEK